MAGELAKFLDGIPVVIDATQREALFPAATRYQNQRVFRIDTTNIERWSGSSWLIDIVGSATINPVVSASIPVVADGAARAALFPSPAVNQRVHNLEAEAIQRWNGTSWEDDFLGAAAVIAALVAGIPIVADEEDRDEKYPNPDDNQRVYRVDTQNTEIWTGTEWEVLYVPGLALGEDILGYGTLAELELVTGTVNGQMARVTNDPTPANNGLYRWEDTEWIIGTDLYTNLAGRVAVLEGRSFPLVPKKNLIDKDEFVRGSRYSPGANAIEANSSWIRTNFIPLAGLAEPGDYLIASGIETTAPMGYGFYADDSDPNSIADGFDTLTPFQVPIGANYVVINITDDGQNNHDYDDTAQLEVGTVATPYEAYQLAFPFNNLQYSDTIVRTPMIFEEVSHNMIDPDTVNYVQRYSAGGLNFVTDTLGIASVRVAVMPGATYVLSGDAVYQEFSGPQGGYLTSAGATTAIANITWAPPLSGLGVSFTVPTGLNISHVALNLWKLDHDPAETALDGTVQLELGSLATVYQAYDPVTQVQPALLPRVASEQSNIAVITDTSWLRFPGADDGAFLASKIPEWRKHWFRRDKDLCMAATGTSLWARTSEHCTLRADGNARPPLMHANNAASYVWDHIRWDGQMYRRYDYPSFFTESGGTFATSATLTEWDDRTYRDSLTRYSGDTGAGVSFVVPVGAWQFNFIYRTDSVAVPDALVTIDEGNDQMEVWDDTLAQWVEANGYEFTMIEPTPVPRNITVPNPSGGAPSVINIASKGNTTYQKRLKLRCKSALIDSRADEKNVTIAGQSAGRFMYWGVEWSPREFMVTYINAARGSHNTQATSSLGLPRFQDNEIWSFKPDLLFFELPIFNDGTNSASAFAANYWSNLTDNFVFNASYELSLVTRGAYWAGQFGIDEPEIGFFTSSIASAEGGGVTADGELVYNTQADGSEMSALDKFNQVAAWMGEHHSDTCFINLAMRYYYAGLRLYNGNLQDAYRGSGKTGNSFTADGTHWNDQGSYIQAKGVLPVFGWIHY